MRQVVGEEIRPSQKIVKIEIKLVAGKFAGIIWLTDIMFQSGPPPTIWGANVSEIQWSFDA
jgi:hypothetical protein